MVKAKEPVAEQWYPMKLGSSCQDDATTRFYSLRCKFLRRNKVSKWNYLVTFVMLWKTLN